MSDKTLLPVEKRRLHRSIAIVSKLSREDTLSNINRYMMRERARLVLRILGAEEPSKIMLAKGIDIIKDRWPFKIKRLRKLINGRRLYQ